MQQTIIGLIFALSWIMCGCTVETFTDGGAPIFLVSFLVMVGTAMILSNNEK